MEHILQRFFMSVLSVSSKAALLAVMIGLTCLLLRRWIPATWRHGLWLLVFIRVMTADNIGEFRWALPSWPEQARVMEERLPTPPETVPDTVQSIEAIRSPDKSSQELMSPIPPNAVMVPPPAVPGSPAVPAIPATPSPVAPSSQPVPWMLIAAGLWLAGALAWWSCLVAGWLRFRHRVLRTSTKAPEFAERLMDEAQVLAGKKGRVRLRVTDKLHTPAICGVWRPVILMPVEAVADLPAEKLRLLLLHELGHTRRMDVLVQVVTSVLLGLHWFNPLLWFAHRQLRAEAEAATDAWVLKHTDGKESRRYGETLIDLAARCSWMGWLFFLAPSVIGAAESSSSLRSRIRAIAAYRTSSRWSWLLGMACVCAMIATGMTQAPQEKEVQASKNESTSTASSPSKNTETPPQTTAPSKSAPTAADLATPGFFIADENRVVLKAGTTYAMPQPREGMAADEIGGVVVDEDGKMVANAEVHVRLFRRAAGEKNPDSVKSDAQGRWTMKGVPEDRQVSGESDGPATGKEFKVTASHPDYLSLDLYHHTPSPGPRTVDFRKGTAVLIMETGLVMKGRVTDKAGKPVANAKIRRGFLGLNVDDPTTMTDAEGNYELKHARAGDIRMRIESKDCAVWMGRVEFHESGTQNFTLDPARKLTVRVLDSKGHPVPKAYVTLQGTTDHAHGGGSIAWGTTGPEGKYTWAWTPPRNVSARVSHESFQDTVTPAKDEAPEVIVTLQPRHRLTLKIVDAVSGKPVPDCTIEKGQAFRQELGMEEKTAWPPNPPFKADAHGVLEDSLSDPKELVVYRITATGYTPHITRALVSADGGATTEVVKLQPEKPLTVRILQGDGQPASKAHVYAMLRTDGMVLQSINDLRRTNDHQYPLEASLEADKDGRCTLPSCPEDTVILVVHESGFSYARWPDVPRGTDWKLGPWARAEGTVLDEGKPVAGIEYEYQGSMALPGQRWVSLSLKGTSDAQGKIIMPTVFPAKQAHFAEIIPPTPEQAAGSRKNRYAWFSGRVQDFEMKVTRAGETTHFDLASVGRKSWTVVGRLVVEGGNGKDKLPQSIFLHKQQVAGARRSSFNTTQVHEDGYFTIGALARGTYQISLADGDRDRYSLQNPKIVLPEAPSGATPEQRTRNIGDVVLMDLSSANVKLEVPPGRTRFRVLVKDDQGKPIPGATLAPAAYRTTEGRGTTFIQPRSLPELVGKEFLTDATGSAEFECAAKTPDDATLSEIQLRVFCDGHVGTYAAFVKANATSTVALDRAGTVIAKVTCKSRPVKGDAVHVVSSKVATDTDAGFIHGADGTHVNRSLREGPLQLQAAWKAEDGSLLFSDVVRVQVAVGTPVTCTLELKPGQRLQGRLDAQVPRPVKNARIAVCVLNVAKDSTGGRTAWNDWQEVREDGTFVFPSLPPGPIYVVALAEGWMSAHESDGSDIVRPLPLTTPLPDEVLIPMVRTASCEVLVLGKNDEPLAGVTVGASPNLNWDGIGNGLLDIYLPSLKDALGRRSNSKEPWSNPESWRTYQAVTDGSGRATITNLPGGTQRLWALPKEWKSGESFTPLAEGQSDDIALGKTGKAVLRVSRDAKAKNSSR